VNARIERAPRILLLTTVSPLEPWGGAAQRTRRLLEALGRCGEPEVLVLQFRYGAASPALAEHRFGRLRVMQLDVPIRTPSALPHFDVPSRAVSRMVARHVDLDAYDLIVSRYVKPAAKLVLPEHVPLIIDDDAVYAPPWRTLVGVRAWLGALARLANDRLVLPLRLKHGRLRRAHYFFCRSAEREAFPWLRSSLLPNLPVVAPADRAPDFDPPAQPALLFLGLLDYPPNRDAVEWFLAAIWPRVLREVPAARFLIAGKGPAHLLERWAAHPGVTVLGFVERLSDAYARASASVVPLRSGGGSSIKALEAYHYGRMVVATSRVVEGHRPLFSAGVHILVADGAAAFAAHCVRALRDPALAAGIAAAGYAAIADALAPERFAATVADAVGTAGEGSAAIARGAARWRVVGARRAAPSANPERRARGLVE
jgi:glycosyltransferase involved in cell wall biosynthesis